MRKKYMVSILRNNEDGFGPAKAFFTILLLVLVGIGGWYVYRFFAQPVGSAVIPVNAPYKAPLPTSATYTDAANVYRLTYPVQQLEVKAQESINISIPLPALDGRVVNFLPIAPNDAGFGANGSFEFMAFSAPATTVLNYAEHGSEQTPVKSLTINGYPALYQQSISTAGTTFTDDEYAVSHNGVTVYFTFRQVQGTSEDVQGFDATAELPAYNSVIRSITFLK
jgi:hypothetical protein